MLNTTRMCLRGISLAMFFMAFDANAAEWSIESDVNSKIEYNDNIFLTLRDHNSVTGLIVTPSLKVQTREKNWETSLDTRLRSNNYSDSNLDSNDIYFDLTGRYLTERNTYSLNGALDFDSNLNSESTDFGITGRRTKREIRRITPQFSRRITERLSFSTSYTHTDVDYIDAENTGFVPYKTDSASGSLVYNLSEKDQVNFVLQATAYESKNKLTEYDSVSAQVGMNHVLSETFSVDFLVGSSQTDSTNRSTQTFDFFGQPVTLVQVTDSSNSGLLLDVGFEQKWLISSLTGGLSRNERTDSFGGLSEVDSIRLGFRQRITSLWNYTVSTRYEDIASINSVNQFSNREIIFIESRVNYVLDRDLIMHASYRYIRRKLEEQDSSKAPDSNRIFVGITYSFPSISTF